MQKKKKKMMMVMTVTEGDEERWCDNMRGGGCNAKGNPVATGYVCLTVHALALKNMPNACMGHNGNR